MRELVPDFASVETNIQRERDWQCQHQTRRTHLPLPKTGILLSVEVKHGLKHLKSFERKPVPTTSTA